ncbi:hypothetical protein [Winogradskyella vincentii]|uniref:Outer membrane protein beta-barrel domain-containing protein n=1 Tax=Winogradskyella vincentii TaxID=2877122 RepID=A0ABS7XW58_9FLAO|nr:hypothetical protein [Winogradskyella vincentii]MCA0151884.1 hypothetical protein [Winogradskyella vincentii]
MRKFLIVLALLTISSNIIAQQGSNTKEWFLGAGLNAINSQGTKSPVGGMGDWAINIPVSAAVELKWNSGLAVEQSITINSFEEGDDIDGILLLEDYSYLSFDTHVKYYFGKHIFPEADWIDFYANSGFGLFSIENTNLSFNLGGGILFWLNRRQTIGIRAQVIGKFALDHSDSGIDNNHYQTHIQAFFAL